MAGADVMSVARDPQHARMGQSGGLGHVTGRVPGGQRGADSVRTLTGDLVVTGSHTSHPSQRVIHLQDAEPVARLVLHSRGETVLACRGDTRRDLDAEMLADCEQTVGVADVEGRDQAGFFTACGERVSHHAVNIVYADRVVK